MRIVGTHTPAQAGGGIRAKFRPMWPTSVKLAPDLAGLGECGVVSIKQGGISVEAWPKFVGTSTDGTPQLAWRTLPHNFPHFRTSQLVNLGLSSCTPHARVHLSGILHAQ